VPQPGDPLNPGDPGYDLVSGSSGNYRAMFNESDPRAIMGGDAFQMLLDMARTGSSAVDLARGAMDPGMAWLHQMLQNPNPLGTGRGDLVREEGLRALQTAVRTGARQIDEESARLGGAYDPEASSFAKGLLRVRGAEGYGGAVAAGQRADLDEQQLNKAFLQSLAQTLQNYGATYGGLESEDFRARIGAAGQAGQLESFARNTWTEVLTRLLGGGGPIQYSVEERGRAREMARPDEGEMFPRFPSFGEAYSTGERYYDPQWSRYGRLRDDTNAPWVGY